MPPKKAPEEALAGRDACALLGFTAKQTKILAAAFVATGSTGTVTSILT